MNKLILTGIFILVINLLFGQNSVTLDDCSMQAIENYPITRQKALLTEANELKVKNLNKNYLPSVMINGQAHYQSDVTKVPIQNLPALGIEPLSKDWYKITMDLSQVIYDGGATKNQKEIESISNEIDQQALEIDYLKLKERINSIYFSILMLKENRNILALHKETLNARLKDIESGIKNGTLLASNADVIKAEILSIDQAIDDAEIMINTAIKVMNELTGLDLTSSTEFIRPEIEIDFLSTSYNRPELSLMNIQQKKIEASKKLTSTKILPKLSAFGQAGYGRPGFDMLKNQFDDFYMIGARLNWNFWDWNKSRKEREIMTLQNQIIDTQKETFTLNLSTDLANKMAEIDKSENKIKRDQELIELRSKITAAAESQLNNGVITASDYLQELNSESKAKLDLKIHQIELIKAKIDYQTTTGN